MPLLEIIKMFLEHPILAVLALPGTLKQLKEWHLGYLKLKADRNE